MSDAAGSKDSIEETEDSAGLTDTEAPPNIVPEPTAPSDHTAPSSDPRPASDDMRPDVEAFLNVIREADKSGLGFPPLYEQSPEDARASYLAFVQMGDAPPHELARIENYSCPGPGGDIALRLYDSKDKASARQESARPAIMFFHGGGFVVGGLESYHSICTDIAYHTGLLVVAVEYRLAPEHPFPAAPDDCEAATRYIAANGEALGLNLSGLITMGDSAGGNLAIVTAIALSREPAALPVLLQVPIYPLAGPIAGHESLRRYGKGHVLDLALLSWFTRQYQGDERDWRCYPILYQGEEKLPPCIMVTAGLDPLRDSGREFAAHHIEHGSDVVYTERNGTVHMFMNLRKIIPTSQSDMNVIYQIIETTLKGI